MAGPHGRAARQSRSPENPRPSCGAHSEVPGRSRHSASARHAHQRNADCGPDLRLDLGGELGVLLQIIARVVLALPDLLAAVRIPRARLLDDVVCNAELDHLALARDALAVENVE